MDLTHKSNLLSSRIVKLLLLLGLVFLLWALLSGKSFALLPPGDLYTPPPAIDPGASNYMPDPKQMTQGNSVYLVVARCDLSNCQGAYQLENLSSTVRIYTNRQNSFTFYIDNGGTCSPEDTPTSMNTNYNLNSLDYTGNNSSPDPWSHPNPVNIGLGRSATLSSADITAAGKACSSYPINIKSTDYGKPGTGEFAGWWAFQFTATLTSGVGWNSFKLSANNGRGAVNTYFSYYSNIGGLQADHFALKSAPNTGTGDFSLTFAANCSASGNKPLHFFDVDAGQRNQLNQNPVVTKLYVYSRSYDPTTSTITTSTTPTNIYNLDIWQSSSQNPVQNKSNPAYQWDAPPPPGEAGGGGNNEGGYFMVPMKPGDLYKWVWKNINDNNGIQFQLPYDNFNAYDGNILDQCGNPTSPPISCSVFSPANGKTIPVNLNTTVRVKATIASGNWPSGDFIKRTGARDNTTGTNDGERTYIRIPTEGGYPSGNTYFGDDVVHPPPGVTSVTYTYQVYDSTGTTVSQPCNVTYNVALVSLDAECDVTRATFPAGTRNIYIQWQDTSGSNVGPVYAVPITDPLQTSYTWTSTFNDFSVLLPHNTYVAELFLNSPTGSPAQTDTLQPCLDGSCPVSPSPVTGEVGQQQVITYVFPITNSTNKDFSSGYSVTVTPNPGLSLPGGASSVNIPVNVRIGTNDVTITFTAIGNYDGSFSIQFDYSGSAIALATWNGQCTDQTQAFTWPYFQAWNSDISSGGGFALPNPNSPNAGVCGDTSNPASTPYITSTTNSYLGGIVAFGREDNYFGSQVDFGAIAMGLIPGPSSGELGFFSGSPYPHTPSSSPKPLFANSNGVRNASNRGGYLDGNPPSNCVKDYYDDFQTNTITNMTSNNLNSYINDNTICPIGSGCQLKYTGDMTVSGATMPSATLGGSPPVRYVSNQVTLFVDGNLTIDGNITYPSVFNPSSQSYIPYLTIIVKGNITLTNNVTQLDGLYIAQPSSSAGTDGVFATCNDYSDSISSDPSIFPAPCNNQLVVNGAVIAQRVELLRSHGTLDQPLNDSSENNVGSNPAEIFNYVPSMVIGSPALPGEFAQPLGLFTLPPVF